MRVSCSEESRRSTRERELHVPEVVANCAGRAISGGCESASIGSCMRCTMSSSWWTSLRFDTVAQPMNEQSESRPNQGLEPTR
jgi:hypothetical protein